MITAPTRAAAAPRSAARVVLSIVVTLAGFATLAVVGYTAFIANLFSGALYSQPGTCGDVAFHADRCDYRFIDTSQPVLLAVIAIVTLASITVVWIRAERGRTVAWIPFAAAGFVLGLTAAFHLVNLALAS